MRVGGLGLHQTAGGHIYSSISSMRVGGLGLGAALALLHAYYYYCYICVLLLCMCPRTSAIYVYTCPHTPPICVSGGAAEVLPSYYCYIYSIRQHTSAYVSIRQHTSAEVIPSYCCYICVLLLYMCPHTAGICVSSNRWSRRGHTLRFSLLTYADVW
jgi:hypothetical protein